MLCLCVVYVWYVCGMCMYGIFVGGCVLYVVVCVPHACNMWCMSVCYMYVWSMHSVCMVHVCCVYMWCMCVDW